MFYYEECFSCLDTDNIQALISASKFSIKEYKAQVAFQFMIVNGSRIKSVIKELPEYCTSSLKKLADDKWKA